MSIRRRTVLQGMLATTAAVAMPAVARAQGAPFKIGLLTVKTGPLAQGGIQMEQGIVDLPEGEEQHASPAARSSSSSPTPAATRPAPRPRRRSWSSATRSTSSSGRSPPSSCSPSPTTCAQRQTPMLSLAAAEDVTQRKANPYVIRPSATSAQCCHVMADYAAKELKLKRVATISEDFAFGHEQMARLPARLRGRRRQGRQEAVAAAGHARTTRPTSPRSATSTACSTALPARTR